MGDEAEKLGRLHGWSRGGVPPKNKPVEKAFGKGYARPPLPPRMRASSSKCERMVELKAQTAFKRRAVEQRRRRDTMIKGSGTVVKQATAAALAPFGHDVNKSCREGDEFRKVFVSSNTMLHAASKARRPQSAIGRPQSALARKSGDTPPPPRWTVMGEKKSTTRIARPQSASSARMRKDVGITLDANLFEKFERSKSTLGRQEYSKPKSAAASRCTRKPISFEKPIIKISTTQGLK